MTDWFDDALKLYAPGKCSYKQISEKLNIPLGTITSRFSRYRKGLEEKQDIDIEELLKFIKKERTVEEMGYKFNCSSDKIINTLTKLKDESNLNIVKFNGNFKLEKLILPTQKKHIFSNNWDGNDKNFIFGVCSDTHFNSKYCQITHLHTFYDICKKEGISRIYHAGDIDEGENMRPGHKYECYAQGADDHCSNIVRDYPKRDGIETFFITGNHDHSMIKHCGFNIGPAIAKDRSDMIYLGPDSATVELTPNCRIELRHPANGSAYAISYHPQKIMESFSDDEKPAILIIGHYHKADYIFYRNIHCVQAGAFEAQTSWMKNKGIAAMVGGWIIEVTVNDDGYIRRFRTTFYPAYESIEDDWKNWSVF